jgi:RNA polymerase sigma-70 factor (ECF subfamily)
VWNTLRRLGVREADVEDLVHDVFLKVYLRRDGYDASRPSRPWLFGFAYRIASDYRRLARHRVEVLGSHHDIPDTSAAPDRDIDAKQQWQIVQSALASVEFDRRAVFMLHEVDGESAPDIAQALGIPLNTVYSRLRVAREEFGTALQRLRAGKGP